MSLTIQVVEQYLYACTYQKNLNEKTVKAYRIDLSQFIEHYPEVLVGNIEIGRAHV